MEMGVDAVGSDASRDLASCDLVTALVADAGLRAPSVYQV